MLLRQQYVDIGADTALHALLRGLDQELGIAVLVQLVRVEGLNELSIGIWERGAGETLASGSSACARVTKQRESAGSFSSKNTGILF